MWCLLSFLLFFCVCAKKKTYHKIALLCSWLYYQRLSLTIDKSFSELECWTFYLENRFINERIRYSHVKFYFFPLSRFCYCRRVHNKGFRNLSSTTKATSQYTFVCLVVFFFERIVHGFHNLFSAICHRNVNNVFHKSGNHLLEGE